MDKSFLSLSGCLCLLLLLIVGHTERVSAGNLKILENDRSRIQPDSLVVFSSTPSAPSLLVRSTLLYGFSGVGGNGLAICKSSFNETVSVPALLKEHPGDPWLAFDKVQHVTFSFLWTLGSQYVLVNKASWSEAQALPASIGTSALMGLSKEMYDWKVGSTRYFSKRDLAADALGIAVATFLILI